MALLQLNLQPSSPSSLPLQNPRFCSPTPLPSRASFSIIFHPHSSSSACKKLSLQCRHSDYPKQRRFSNGTPNDSPVSLHSHGDGGAVADGPLPSRVFIGHSIYKGKAALTVEPRAPEFNQSESGAFKLSKEGYVTLQFAPASGLRQYDWSKKLVFSLSLTEIGAIISLGAGGTCEFIHDPNKGRSEEGRINKRLKVAPLPDESGFSFKLSVFNKQSNVEESIYIPITRAEFAILVSALNYIVPYLMGWRAYADSLGPEDSIRLKSAFAKSGAEQEWSR